jgi:hypothetical protein
MVHPMVHPLFVTTYLFERGFWRVRSSRDLEKLSVATRKILGLEQKEYDELAQISESYARHFTRG